MTTPSILLVEDEQAIADTLLYVLRSEGFAIHHVMLGRDVLPALQRSATDLVILDVGLPDTTGFEVLKVLRATPEARHLPVIFLTARADEIDRVLGLELGADDYVTKPFSPREVAARVRAILRRDARARSSTDAPLARQAPSSRWTHAAEAMSIAYHGTPLDLTRYEYRLLALLLSSPGRVFTREQIMERVWADAPETTDRSIDTHIKTLRAKLREIAPADEAIVTHRGTGYALALETSP